MEKVSVIVPVWNAGRYLPQCLDSLLGQSYGALEIILVDDGSTDNSAEICRMYAERDERVCVLRQENKGVSAARNLGLERASGKLIAFVDADDWVDREHIALLVQGIHDSDGAICGYWLEYPQRREERSFSALHQHSGDEAVARMLSPYLYQGFLCNKLFDAGLMRQSGLRLSERIYYFEDLLFCAEYFSHCGKVACVPQATYHYRQHRGSAIGRDAAAPGWLERRLTAVEALKRAEAYCTLPEARRLCEARQHMEYAQILRRVLAERVREVPDGELKKAVRRGWRIVCSAPLPPRAKLKYIATALFPKLTAGYWTGREQRYFQSVD